MIPAPIAAARRGAARDRGGSSPPGRGGWRALAACAAALLLAGCRVSDQPPPRADAARDSPAVAAAREAAPADTATDPASRARRRPAGRKVHRALALTPVSPELPAPVAAVVELADTFRADPGDSLNTFPPELAVVVLQPTPMGWRTVRTDLHPHNSIDYARQAESRGEPVPSWAAPSNTARVCFGVEDVDGDGDLEVWAASSEAGARAFLLTIHVYDVETGATHTVQMQSGEHLEVRPSYAEYSASASPAIRRWLWGKVESVAEAIYLSPDVVGAADQGWRDWSATSGACAPSMTRPSRGGACRGEAGRHRGSATNHRVLAHSRFKSFIVRHDSTGN